MLHVLSQPFDGFQTFVGSCARLQLLSKICLIHPPGGCIGPHSTVLQSLAMLVIMTLVLLWLAEFILAFADLAG